MKSAHLVCLLVCLLFAAFVHAQEKDDPAKDKQINNKSLRILRKPARHRKSKVIKNGRT
jgi:hypothetical protein